MINGTFQKKLDGRFLSARVMLKEIDLGLILKIIFKLLNFFLKNWQHLFFYYSRVIFPEIP